MIRSGLAYALRRVTITLCLAVLVLGFVPESGISQAAQAEQQVYILQRGTPAAIPNFIDISSGCNWSGIGGQVFNRTGTPMNGLRVKISGSYDGRQILQFITTGSSQRFGPGGFDYKLGDRPITSQSLILQLFDANGLRLSLPFILRTDNTCQQNLVVINLAEISTDNVTYLPQVFR